MTTGGDDVEGNKNIAGDEVRGDKVEGNKVVIGSISGVKDGGVVNVVGGNIFQRITHVFSGISDRVLERFRKQQLIGFAALVVIIIGSALALYLGLRPRQPASMPGGFGIVVAGFTKVGSAGDKQLGVEVAKEIQSVLQANLEEIPVGKLSLKYPITIWGPDQVGSIQGKTSEKRALKAEELAQKIGAEIIIYGVVTTTLPVWKVVPEFYVSTDSFYDAQEITGQSQFGSAIELPEQIDLAGLNMIAPMYIRSQALSRLTLGLVYFAARQYPDALKMFQSAETIPGWEDDQGKEVLYLLMGNAAGKDGQIELACQYFEQALAIDPEYARAYIGLGSAAYIRALEPALQAQDMAKVDQGLLDQSIEYHARAMQALHKPALADIQAKVHFGLGQAYLAKALSGQETYLSHAIAEFNAVIQEYDNGSNPRIWMQAAESHARLGLIYKQQQEIGRSIQEYELAVQILQNFDSQKATLYAQRAAELRQTTITP